MYIEYTNDTLNDYILRDSGQIGARFFRRYPCRFLCRCRTIDSYETKILNTGTIRNLNACTMYMHRILICILCTLHIVLCNFILNIKNEQCGTTFWLYLNFAISTLKYSNTILFCYIEV
jgi:hypothetical protein